MHPVLHQEAGGKRKWLNIFAENKNVFAYLWNRLPTFNWREMQRTWGRLYLKNELLKNRNDRFKALVTFT